MSLLHVLILAVVQGLCELLPVSSSAHVILVEMLLGLDPTAPEMTLLLVMLHTGTMLAVILYFWKAWKRTFFASSAAFWRSARTVVLASALTAAVFIALKLFIERVLLGGAARAEIEQLFGNAYVIAAGLATVGAMIILSGRGSAPGADQPVGLLQAAWIGAVQGICLTFRGFSRSGATISTALFLGLERMRAEEFSFALAVVLTPPAIFWEARRLLHAHEGPVLADPHLRAMLWLSVAGAAFSFLAGLLALRWLSRWLERGRWAYFGYYCLFLSATVLAVHSLRA